MPDASSTIINLNPDPLATPPSKPSSKSRRSRTRRRVQSDHESDGGESDRGSLTDASSGSDEDDDTDDEAAPPATSSKDGKAVIPAKIAAATSTAPVFASTTPLIWADLPPDEKIEEVTFEEFAGGRGRGRGGKAVATRERKELTEEGKLKLAAKREKKKEKLKEKRKAEKAAKALAKQAEKGAGKKVVEAKAGEDDGGWGGGPIQPGEASTSKAEVEEDGGWGEGVPSRTVSEWATNSLKPEEADDGGWAAAPANGAAIPPVRPNRKTNNREPYPGKIFNDPRPNAAWAHDQLAGEMGNGFAGRGMARGRGQPLRGERGAVRGVRGRGRGFGPGQAVGYPTSSAEGVTEQFRRLEMDKAGDEEKTRAERGVGNGQAATAAGMQPSQWGQRGESAQRGGGKWGHDGFEQRAQFERDRAKFIGVPRGRGAPRGLIGRGGITHIHQQPPHQRPTPPHSTAAPAAPPSSEDHITRPTVEDLLPAESGVTVHLPGSKETISVPLPSSSNGTCQPTPQPPIPSTHTQPNPTPLPLHLTGGSNQSPSPFTPRSENGSNSSSNFAPPPSCLPPGIGMTPNGEYYNIANGAPVDFHPAQPGRSFSAAAGRPFHPTNGQRPAQQYPSGYTNTPSPQFYDGPAGYGFDPSFRPDSPYASPFPAPAQLGYFAPPAPSKRVLIRDPSTPADSTPPPPTSSAKAKQGAFTPAYQPAQDQPYYSSAYNPYAQGVEMEQYGYGWQGQGQQYPWDTLGMMSRMASGDGSLWLANTQSMGQKESRRPSAGREEA